MQYKEAKSMDEVNRLGLEGWRLATVYTTRNFVGSDKPVYVMAVQVLGRSPEETTQETPVPVKFPPRPLITV